MGVEGIYDFVALRDAHLAYREVYEGFIAGALGPEEKGGGRGWSKADIAGAVRGRKREEEEEEEEEERRRWGVVLGWSKGDELVEVGQMEGMQGALRGAGWNDKGEGKRNVRIVELKGGHDEIWEKGEEMARAIEGGLELCLETDG